MSDHSTVNQTRRGFRKGAGVTAGSAAMLAGLNQSAQAQSADPVVIGCPTPLTGIVASDGIEFQRGLEMARDEINEMGAFLASLSRWHSSILKARAMTW